MFLSSRADSATTDESVHLFAGFTYLTQKDFRLDTEHPPLIKEIAAIPLLFLHPKYQLNSDWQKAGNFYYDSWKEARAMGNSFMFLWGNNADQLLIYARIMMILLTLVLGLTVYFYAKKLYGEKAGIFATFLTLFCPIILSHGRLVNTDIGVTLFIVLTVYLWGNYLKKPSWWGFVGSGIFLGLALSSKFTAVILVPIMIGLLLINIYLDKSQWQTKIFALIGAIAIAFIIIWAAYGFSLSSPPFPHGGISAEINSWSSVPVSSHYDNLYNHLRAIFVPADFYKGLSLISRHVVGGNGSFLLGHNSTFGWWYYFPVAIFFKTPIAIFIFLIISLIYFKKCRSKDIFDECVLIVSPLIFLLFAMLTRADLGVRHVLPIFPFLIIFASKSINTIDFKKINVTLVIFCAAVLWYIVIVFSSFPNYIAYFNEFAGGSQNGYKILTDSNLDWGQDIFRIKNYLVTNNITNPYLVYPWEGDEALNYYGIKFIPLTPEMQNVHGPAIVSATYYDTDAYSWLKKFPKTLITPGVFLVQLN